MAGYSVDWNNVALQAITAGLDEIPVVGGILSHLLEAFWPESGQDVWGEIKDQVQALINQSISSDVYSRVQAQLGTAAQDSGMVGVLNNYLGSITPTNNNGQDPKDTWTAANATFIGAEGVFQQSGSEVMLLPLFAQFANMHLSLLRDGVQRNWCNISELQQRITTYVNWAQQWIASGHSSRASANKGFNYVNEFDRQYQLGVGNFCEVWPYFDLSKYQPPVKNIVFTNEVYYSITETMGSEYPGGNYTLAAPPTTPITNVGVYWLEDTYDNYNLVLGTQVTYSSGAQGYTGVLINNGIPPINTPFNPNNDYFGYFVNQVSVTAGNPIVSVQGAYEATGGTYCTEFTFQNGGSTGLIPSQADQDYPHNYKITPPSGYFLSSIWVPEKWSWYQAAADMVFGFQLNPLSLDGPTAKALFTSSLHGVDLTSPRFAPFAGQAVAENWEAQRQAYLKRLSS